MCKGKTNHEGIIFVKSRRTNLQSCVERFHALGPHLSTCLFHLNKLHHLSNLLIQSTELDQEGILFC